MFSKITTYVGKRDRESQEVRRREARHQDVQPRSELEKAIYDNRAVILKFISNKAKASSADALNVYMNARMHRHDVWVDYLSKCKAKHYYRFNDIRVGDFHEDFMKKFPCPDMPENLKRLTPDILIYDTETATIYIGDVACTNSVRDADRRKYLKYKPIAEFYLSNKYKVKHTNFIVDNSLTNIAQIIRDFENIGLITPVIGVRSRSNHYFTMASKTMVEAQDYCSDPIALQNMILISDKVQDDDYDQIDLPEGIPFKEIQHDVPNRSEEEIIKDIKHEVEAMGEYFDSGIQDTKKAFIDLKEKNSTREHLEPKSTLKVCSNQADMEEQSDYRLLESYLADMLLSDNKETMEYVKWLLPSRKQINAMKDVKNNIIKDNKDLGVYGSYQYKIPRADTDNYLINRTIKHLQHGKKLKNEKEAPKTIDPNRYLEIFSDMEATIEHYGSISNKPSFLDNSWDSATQFETDNSDELRRMYKYVSNTNGAQLAHSMSNLYQRLCHLKTSLSTKDNIYIPPNGSFIVIIPKDHAPVTSSSCDVPMIFLTRVKKTSKSEKEIRSINEFEYMLETDDYYYMVSKLCRLSINKMANWESAGYRLVATASYIASLNSLVDVTRIVGILTIMMLDVHQKTSELLDLLKYVAFMPFSDITRLSTLIMDKFDIMIKTKLDVWTIINLENLIKELSELDKLKAVKPKLQLHNGVAIHESFGMKLELPSIYDMKIRHVKVENYIEEIAMIYTVRGKQLYGSQFMDKSIYQTAAWEHQYQEEKKKYGEWVVTGQGEGPYPFKSQFSFDKDAIIYALQAFHSKIPIAIGKTMRDLSKGSYNDFMHYNCSLRGCMKEPEDRLKPADIHTTSMEACLHNYEKNNYDTAKATSNSIAYEMMRAGKKMEFSMSEKEQRGGGRPIATPTLGTKASLMLLEKPEVSIGKQAPNNVIVPGKNKLQEQCECFKKFITQAALEGFKELYQITEDQSKFSEMDNPRKFIPYIHNNPALDSNVKKIQLKVIDMICDREHVVKRMPKTVIDSHLVQYLNSQRNGVQTTIGWPQGMCNFISTSIHMIADIWITEAYNKAYPTRQVKTAGLVHSDDSWVTVATNNIEDFKLFCKFRLVAKKMFCLKMNEKKLWGSRYLGELVSNYNINGNVHLCISKTIANAFTGLTYQNWVLDVHTQISVLQQSYRQGATIPVLIMLSTILRQQIMSQYQVSGLQRELLSDLPIELGGYPSNSVFELATNGVNCHYYQILQLMKQNPNDIVTNIVLRCLRLSMMKLVAIEEEDINREVRRFARTKLSKDKIEESDDVVNTDNVDYTNIQLPYRGDVFSCVNHIMPQSKKVKLTVKRIKSLPFVSDGLELLVTKPKELGDALGHLKDQTSTMLYTLAADKYTQSARRLAVSQSLQATGKTVKLNGLKPMTMHELLDCLNTMDNIPRATIEQLETAFTDSNPVPVITNSIVFNSESVLGTTDKRKIINRLPEIDDNFRTLTPIKDILLYIIESEMGEECYTKYSTKKSPIQLVEEESVLIRKRFCTYFKCYRTKVACNLIMKLFMENKKTRLWMQPFLNQENITTFLEDLYGKSVSSEYNYRIMSSGGYSSKTGQDSDIVRSIYTCCVLDSLYPDHFKPTWIGECDINAAISNIDYGKLSIEDLLKYAIIRYYLNGDDMMLRQYDQARLFSKKYILPQRFINGRYEGKFKCEVKYGTTVMVIDGEPGDVRIKVNKLNINEVLMGMMLFINDSFPTEKYSHPTLWHKCTVWNSKFKVGKLFLSAYTQSASHFTPSPIVNSIVIEKDDNLKFDDLYIERQEASYLVEDHLRTVYKVTEENKIRIGNVKQNMTCPLAKKITCIENPINHMSNNALLNSKIILNLTMRRPFANSKADIAEILQTNNCFDDGVLVAMYKNLLSKFASDITPTDYANMQPLEVIDDIMLSGFDVSQYISKYDETKAEDLTYIETNFVYEETEEVNAMVQYNSIIKYLCQCYMINQTESDKNAILSGLLNDPNIMKMITKDIDDPNTNELLTDMMNNAERECHIDTICYIIANDLDIQKGWENADIRYLLKENLVKDISKHGLTILNTIKSDMDLILFDSEHKDAKDQLLRRLEESL